MTLIMNKAALRSISALALRVAALLLVSTSFATLTSASDLSPPKRVVSTNLCTDQLALILASPGQLRSVSYISHDPKTSYLYKRARRLKPNHGLAEEIFLMRPDLILAGGFTRRATSQLLTRLGFRVETFYPAQTLADVRTNILRLGRLLGRSKHARTILQHFDLDLARAKDAAGRAQKTKTAALYYANNYTSGSRTLAGDIVAHAGLDNIGTSLGLAGMVKLPLELLVMHRPDVIIAEPRDTKSTALAYQTFTHPALKAAATSSRAFLHTNNTWACGTPFTINAIRGLAAAARKLDLKAHSPSTGVRR